MPSVLSRYAAAAARAQAVRLSPSLDAITLLRYAYIALGGLRH